MFLQQVLLEWVDMISNRYWLLSLLISGSAMARHTVYDEPFFRCTKSNKVNARSGPGKHYKLLHTYVVRHLPLSVLKEYNGWSHVRDIDGALAWVDSSLLCKVKSAVTVDDCVMYKDQRCRDVFVHVRKNTIVRIKKVYDDCVQCTCFRKVGYVKKEALWGI